MALADPDAALDLAVRTAVYDHFAQRAGRPAIAEVAATVGSAAEEVEAAYRRLAARRMLVLEKDGRSIRMASPFSGVPTQHVAEAGGRRHFSNCAWDVLGVLAALGEPGIAHSRCEQSGEVLRLEVTPGDGPEPCDWLFHCSVPAAHWWDDIVFT